MVLTTSDLAKYPFVPAAAEEVKRRDLKIENLMNPDYREILDRAEERIEDALKSNPPRVSYRPHQEDIEILSFPVAVVLAAASVNDYIKRRYALAEAARAADLLAEEKEDAKIVEVAKAFNWKLRMPKESFGHIKFDFAVHFTDFLRNTESFHAKEWKLVNRPVVRGDVYLGRRDVARLLQEEVRRRIEVRLASDVRSILQPPILERVDRLKQIYARQISEKRFEELPKELVNEAFPPCVRQLYDAAKSGRHISHVGRFTLTTFLLHAGMEPDKVVELFHSSSDFNERLTRYQVEHIGGSRGSRTRYNPPKCETLQTHGVCPGVDDLCRNVRHPLNYYRRRLRMLKKEAPVSQV
ncbi:MAG: DNA primase large subunit PriL [Nitrososphaerota archaeon]